MTINEQAIEAAAEAMHQEGWTCEAHEPLGLDHCDQCADSTPKVVQKILIAAMPHIREQIAKEIEAAQFKVDSLHHFHGAAKCLCGYDSHHRARSATEHITQALNAARIVRGES